MQKFPLIDKYLGTILDVDVAGRKPGETIVADTTRRLRRETSYNFVHALYGIFFSDGSVAFSVTPGARSEIVRLLQSKPLHAIDTFDLNWLDNLLACINHSRSIVGLAASNRIYETRLFVCNGAMVRRHYQGDCHRLKDESIPPIDGLSLPSYCFPDGIVYGIIVDDHVVSVAYAHRSGLMEDQIADLGVETAAPYRNCGYAKTVVSAVTDHITSTGGEAIYNCSSSNLASMATASRVGYRLYGKTIVITAPASDQ